MNFVDLFEGVAARRREHPFLTWSGGGRATFGHVARVVADQAALLERAGAGGRRVGIMCANRPELVTLWLACMKAGVTPVFLNPALTSRELETIIDDLEVGVVFSEAGTAAGVVVQLPEMPAAAAVDLPAITGSPCGDKDVAAVILTSGSTGHPKYVPVPHAAYFLKAVINAAALGWNAGDNAYCVMPLFHIGAQVETLMPAIATGATVHLESRFSASRLWDDVREQGTTTLHSTGSLLLMALARSEPGHLPLLRRFVGALREDLAERLLAAVPGVDMISVYGLSECPLATLSAPGESYRSAWIGYPCAGPGSVRLVAEDGNEAGSDAPGEIQLRNAACTPGYLVRPVPELYTGDGWLRTGDVGYRGDGGFYLAGRIKEMIRRSGENIAPAEVEEAAMRHAAVAEAAVIRHPDPIREEEVRLFVELVPGREVDPGELRRFVAESLAKYKVPRYIDFVAALPRTPSNKIDKVQLAAEAALPRWDCQNQTNG